MIAKLYTIILMETSYRSFNKKISDGEKYDEVYEKLKNKIPIGQCVLDQSKFLLYDFHYNFMLEKIERKNIDFLFTDTDNLCYHIKNQNPYEIINENKDLFDLSAYPKSHSI